MINLTQQDLEVRLQLTNCCLAEKSNNLLTKISTGSNDVNCALQELTVLFAMLEILSCYHVYDIDNPTDFDNNCLTEQEANDMFKYISKKCGIQFQRPGFPYQENIITT